MLKRIGQRLEERSAHTSVHADNGQREAVEALLASLDPPAPGRAHDSHVFVGAVGARRLPPRA